MEELSSSAIAIDQSDPLLGSIEDHFSENKNENMDKRSDDPIAENLDDVRHEALCAPTSSEQILEQLLMVADFVRDNYSNVLHAIIMRDSNEIPFLSVVGLDVDPFFKDRSAISLMCTVDEEYHIVGKLLTFHRDVIADVITESPIEDMLPLLEKMAAKQYAACQGFGEKEFPEIFHRLRKNDYDRASVGMYANKLILRARFCSYYVNTFDSMTSSDPTPLCCPECSLLFNELNQEIFGEPASAEGWHDEGQGGERRKRGRPKGSKKKFSDAVTSVKEDHNEEVDLKLDIKSDDQDAFNAVVTSDYDNPTDDFNFDQSDADSDEIEGLTTADEDPKEADFSADQVLRRHGLRQRVTTNRQKALMELAKRKRGRPPVIAGPFECNECSEKFNILRDFKKHKMEHTNSFLCDFGDCERRFKNPKDLEIHMRKHRGEKPYVCNECDKAYQIRQDLKLHMRKHTGNRPYKCDLCPKTFARAQQRKIHRVVHTGERAFLCSECGSSFASVSTLIDHRKRRHLLVRNHQCNDCSKAFFTKQELAAHNRTHTGDKPYQCEDCKKCFSRPHHLKRHMSGIHRCEKSRSTVFYVTKGDNGDDGDETGAENNETDQILGFDKGETIIVTTSDETLSKQVLMENDEFVETEYVLHDRTLPSSSRRRQLVVQKTTLGSSGDLHEGQVHYIQLTDDAGQIGPHLGGGHENEATIVLHQDNSELSMDTTSVIEITGSEDPSGYVLITTGENEQKLIPVSHFVSAMQQQHQD